MIGGGGIGKVTFCGGVEITGDEVDREDEDEDEDDEEEGMTGLLRIVTVLEEFWTVELFAPSNANTLTLRTEPAGMSVILLVTAVPFVKLSSVWLNVFTPLISHMKVTLPASESKSL